MQYIDEPVNRVHTNCFERFWYFDVCLFRNCTMPLGKHRAICFRTIFKSPLSAKNIIALFTPTTCKTRPAGQVWPATRFCPAREMFLNYNTNRPAACHRPPLPMMYHSRLRCLPLYRLKPNVINNVQFFWI